MALKQNIFYSLPEVWDICLGKIYNKKSYVKGLDAVLKNQGITNTSLILDAGCGSGFPTIDLSKKGYRVIATDKSSEMVRQIQFNAKKEGISVEAYHIMWADLAKKFDSAFDFIYCRGNSLVYAASWEQNWIVPERSREEILKAIQNFYQVLKPGGKLYIDVMKKDEKPHQENIGEVMTKEGPVSVIWKIEHDTINKVRIWTIILEFLQTGEKKFYSSYSYLLSHDELIGFLKSSGFRKINQNVRVAGENNYDVFLVRK